MNKELMRTSEIDGRYVVIFDGVCNFCNGTVNFIIKRDANGVFCFAPMQNDLAKALAREYYHGETTLDTLILIKHEKVYIRSNAALEIAKDLSGYWFLLNIFKVIPRPIRDFLYNTFAKKRYALFGKRNHCMVPTKDVLDKFVGIQQ